MTVTGNRAMRLLVACFLAASAFSDARAEDFVPVGFKTPSGNIFCQAFAFDKQDSLRCDVMRLSGRTPPRPRDCEYDWGQAFAMRSGSEGERICYSDTTMDDRLPVLQYGARWRHGPFTCISDEAGVTCLNETKHGFVLSRAAQRLF